MAKQWRIFAYPGWFTSFREVIPDRNVRYKISNAIEEQFKQIEDPSRSMTLVPNETEHYEIAILGYTIIVRWRKEQPNDIVLLELY